MSPLHCVALSALFAASQVLAAEPSEPRGKVLARVKLVSKGALGTATASAKEAVVFLDYHPKPPPPPKDPLPRMVQRNKAFEPPLVIVQAGERVTFPNEDKVFHNVFSLSAGNEFDLGLYREGASKTVRFQKPGAVNVFCNIHPQMIGSILVLQNPFYAQDSDDDGIVELELPAGLQRVVAWWAKGPTVTREVQVPAGGTVTLDLELVDTGQAQRHLNKFGQPYGRYK